MVDACPVVAGVAAVRFVTDILCLKAMPNLNLALSNYA